MEDQFSYAAVRQRLEEFAETIPGLLIGHPLTAKYAVGLHNLLDQVDSPFTVAVTGQMRVGKSTLLNALIGENLAITGVNETTATINWFKHGPEELADKFNVVWKGQPEELVPLSEIEAWVGDSEKAALTRYLEFFSTSELLKNANFIDTPGTRSTIESHEETINEFLAQRCENETLRQGGKADAIVYVFPPVARESDKDRLDAYGTGSRIPGSSPFNSIGVLHKWDHLEGDNPVLEAARKAATVAEAMKDLVADVIPVSAPLYIAADRNPDDFWDKIVALSLLEDDLDFEELLGSDACFKDADIPGCALSTTEREQFLSDYLLLPWASLKLILMQVRREGLSLGEDARAFILEQSGIPRLREQLEQRFFSKSRLIKILGCLNRAWEPCLQASIALRSEKVELATGLDALPEYLDYIGTLGESGHPVADRLHAFLSSSQEALRDRVQANAKMLSNLDRERLVTSDARDHIGMDIDCLEQLSSVMECPYSPEIAERLQSLFGSRGSELSRRCAWCSEDNLDDDLLALQDELLDVQVPDAWGRLKGHAMLRIDQILDALED